MGVVADFMRVPEDAWPTALSRLRAAGIEVRDEGTERGVTWYSCRRGACCIGLGYGPGPGGPEVTVYGPALRFWRRPLGMYRLYRDVRRALLAGS
jgi:hypothetical protein